MSNDMDSQAKRDLILGRAVSKSTGVLANGITSLFTIAGGRVVVTSLVGRVTVAIGSTVSNAKLTFNPTAAGTSVDICTAVAITSDAVEQTYTLATTHSTAAPGALIVAGDVGWASPVLPFPDVFNAGVIEQNLSADPVGGEITWTVTYIPLDNGASLVAA
jgi:hypothetical protein